MEGKTMDAATDEDTIVDLVIEVEGGVVTNVTMNSPENAALIYVVIDHDDPFYKES